MPEYFLSIMLRQAASYCAAVEQIRSYERETTGIAQRAEAKEKEYEHSKEQARKLQAMRNTAD